MELHAVRQLKDSLRRRANARNVSFRISLRWLTYIVNSVDKTKLSYKSHGACSGREILKSVNPKISSIDRQKRNTEFFLIWPKEPICMVTYFRKWHQKVRFPFLSSKFAKLEISATRPSAAAMRLEIWHMFNMLVCTYQTLSWHVLYTVCGASLKLYSGLKFA